MKHLLKKLSIAGAGGKGSKPKPPIYKPPVMGELQYGASHSYAETLDLLSDGPIEGIVNSHGELVDGLDILQGIYLDDTPVAVSNQTAKKINALTDLELETFNSLNMELNSTEGVLSLSKFFQEIAQVDRRSGAGKITSLKSNPAGPIDTYEADSSNNANMMFFRTQSSSPGVPGIFVGPPILPRSNSDYAIYIRQFIKYRDSGTAQTFPLYFNENLLSASDANAAYRNDSQPKGEIQEGSLIWADNSSLDTSKFLFALNSNVTYLTSPFSNFTDTLQLFQDNIKILSEKTLSDLNSILDLYNNNDQGEVNQLQKELAARTLKRIGWNEGAVDTLLPNYLSRDGGNSMTPLTGSKTEVVIICKVNSSNSNLNKNILDGDALMKMETVPFGTKNKLNITTQLRNLGATVTDVTCPEILSDGTLTGTMHGFLIFQFATINQIGDNNFKTTDGVAHVYGRTHTFQIPSYIIELLKDVNSFKYGKKIEDGSNSTILSLDPTINSIQTNQLKFNYSNVLAEIRKGEESQTPFDNFKKIFIDHPYNRELFGRFGTAATPVTFTEKQENAPQRISPNPEMLTRSKVLERDATNFNAELGQDGLPTSEGSDDVRNDSIATTRNYSTWGNSSFQTFDEEAIPVIHTIYNPNVEEVFITLDVSSLRDTLIRDVKGVKNNNLEDNEDLKTGTTFPTVLNIKVETGFIDDNGDQIIFRSYNYRIVALIEGSTLIDIGNPDYKSSGGKEFVVELTNANDNENYLSQPFQLPNNKTSTTTLTSDGELGIEAGVIDQTQDRKRFVKIEKLSYETNSILLSKVVSVSKVTEIINADLPYPFSAIVGTKLDSRSFSSVPRRSYDCKLKKVKVPSNYFPANQGVDKRYYNTEAEFTDANPVNKSIYKGDWDGSFHQQLQWTDNPAWILYDLLTNVRYGMGSHIDANRINKWQLYKIGKFCDNVDNEGNFLGVTDGRGGIEPRFSCNIVFDKGQKIFDAINTVASLFRGRTFFSNSEINFVDDRPRSAVNLFTNESVKDGLFFYSNNRRDEQFNTIEIGYRDRFDNYTPKIEVVEDEEDIKERGIFKKRIEGVGITSRAMARRAAQHQIFSKIRENQQVAFTAGLETLLCKPGDLVIVEDELKTNITNFGKILDVNLEDETIRLSNTSSSLMTTGVLTIYNPTGIDGVDELNITANQNRQRYDGFTITGLATSSWKSFTGDYSFSNYTEGYDQSTGFGAGETRYSEYASYTGVSGTNIYFETGVTGWVLGSGDARSLYSGDFIAKQTGAQTLTEFNTGRISILDMNAVDKRGANFAFGGFDSSTLRNYTRGLTNSELSGIAPEQIIDINVTGIVTNLDYGCSLSGFNKPELLKFIKLGSTARFQIKDASPFFYKVISMKEENPNEYLVTATKYDTGKFNLIDKNISIENKVNTFSYQVAQVVNGVVYETLDTPTFVGQVTTGIPNVTDQTFNISGNWNAVTNSTGYGVRLTQPNGQIFDTSTTDTNIVIDGLNQVGVFNLGVNALGNMARSCGDNAYYDSPYINTGLFIVYEDSLSSPVSFLNTITIL